MCLVGSSPPAKQPAARRLQRMILGRSPLYRLDCTVLYCTVLYCNPGRFSVFYRENFPRAWMNTIRVYCMTDDKAEKVIR